MTNKLCSFGCDHLLRIKLFYCRGERLIGDACFSLQLTWNEISGFILKFIIKVSDELTLSTQVFLLHWRINPSRRFTICFIRVGFRRNNCHSRVSGELKMEQQQYSLFATTWQGGHVGVQYNKLFSGRIYMKIEFTSQRREMLLVLTTSKPPWRHAHTSSRCRGCESSPILFHKRYFCISLWFHKLVLSVTHLTPSLCVFAICR